MLKNKHQNLRIAFIGGGNMAFALGQGLIKEAVPSKQLLVIDPSANAQKKWLSNGISTQAKPTPALAQYDIWFFAVKPQQLYQVCQACKPYLQSNTLVVSVAAGIRAIDISRWLTNKNKTFKRIVRCMPNTPALISQGATGMMALPGVTQKEKKLTEQLLSSVGTVVWVEDDKTLDVVTALSGSGPAYVFLFLESMIEAGTKLGLNLTQAEQLAVQTLVGASQLAASANLSVQELRENVTSEGGTTAAALAVLEKKGFKRNIENAMQAAADRATQLAHTLAKIECDENNDFNN